MTIDEFKENIAPYMMKGWAAMDQDKRYWWFIRKPRKFKHSWCLSASTGNDFYCISRLFDIEPVEDWTKSLIEVGR